MSEKSLGNHWDSAMSEDVRQAFWDIANLSERANMNQLVKHNLDLAQRNIHAAWQLQTHMNEQGEYEKGQA
jgi:hypothetical protein